MSEIGFDSTLVSLAETITEEELLAKIKRVKRRRQFRRIHRSIAVAETHRRAKNLISNRS
jgi:5,10-methylene-tetrahydrofolate dehydrogenase/methenyl tetrahydrofolate cyclohydrolase